MVRDRLCPSPISWMSTVTPPNAKVLPVVALTVHGIDIYCTFLQMSLRLAPSGANISQLLLTQELTSLHWSGSHKLLHELPSSRSHPPMSLTTKPMVLGTTSYIIVHKQDNNKLLWFIMPGMLLGIQEICHALFNKLVPPIPDQVGWINFTVAVHIHYRKKQLNYCTRIISFHFSWTNLNWLMRLLP